MLPVQRQEATEMSTQFESEPPPVEWPYWWSPEYDIAVPTTCICEDGFLPLPDQTMIACYVCNYDQ